VSRSRQPKEKPEAIPWTLLGRALSFLLRYRRTLAVAIVSTTGTAILWFAWPYFFRGLTDAAVAGNMQTFWHLLVAALGAMLLDSGAQYVRGVTVSSLGASAIRDMRNCITAHIQRLPMLRLQVYHSGDLLSRLNNDLDQTTKLFQQAPNYVYSPVQLIGGLAFMLWISPKLTLVICASMPVSVVLFERVIRPMQRHSGEKMKSLAAVNASLQDAIRGAPIVRAFGLQGVLGRRFDRQVKDVERHDMRNQIRAILSFIPFLTLRYIPQLLVPIYGGLLAFRGEISVGDLLAANYLIWTVFRPLEAFLEWVRETREAAPALHRTFEILDTTPERAGGNPVVLNPTVDPIVVDRVAFSYADGPRVLDGATFHVAAGRSVALVGSSGCGKTTILRALCGFVDPEDGEIRLYGQPLARADLASAREHVSLMAQDPFLFPTSIRTNIAFGHPDATEDDIVAAATAAHAHEFICSLPDGYETNAGELGHRLSVGQKQRVCLARTILRSAPILLLDEPTAALDSQSEAIVLEAFERLMHGKTTILVSHRLSTLRNVDEIFLLDGGRIACHGTHEELIAGNSLYRAFAMRQTDGRSKGCAP